jgi:hypothetical protein
LLIGAERWASAKAIAAWSWSSLAGLLAIGRAGRFHIRLNVWVQRYRHGQPVAMRMAAVLPSPAPFRRPVLFMALARLAAICFSVAMAPALMSPTAVRLVGLVCRCCRALSALRWPRSTSFTKLARLAVGYIPVDRRKTRRVKLCGQSIHSGFPNRRSSALTLWIKYLRRGAKAA